MTIESETRQDYNSDDDDNMDHDAARRRRRREEQQFLSVDHGGPSSNGGTHQPSRRRRRAKRQEEPETVSLVLIVQVGASLLVFFGVLFMVMPGMMPATFSSTEQQDDGYYEARVALTPSPTVAPRFGKKATAPPLPVWELSSDSRFDAYGIGENVHAESRKEFWDEAAALRQDFSDRYGGENAARAALERALSTFGLQNDTNKNFPSDLEHSACRIQAAAKGSSKTFSMAFGGYSVTAGRGNLFEQSYPFVMERTLKRAFRLLGVSLVVRNAAIGGVPSFPYGWCMSNFWGEAPDLVSWDYSMNEAGGVPGGLEAYLRHVTVLGHNPKLVVKDTHMAKERRDLLRRYVESGSLSDPVVIHTDPAVNYFLDLPEDFRPEGYQEWRVFGAPKGVPGQSRHHPAVKEHEFIAWVLSMHFLSALELAAESNFSLECSFFKKSTATLPAPMNITNETWSSVLFGEPSKDDAVAWKMNPTHCRTTFEPIVDGDLSSLIVAGVAGQDVDIMLPKGPMFYSKGWVLDISDKEKKAKRELDRFGRLGFVDSKKAYYGIYASGPLRLLLPFETSGKKKKKPDEGDEARKWFKSVVVCQVNEKRDPGECIPETDVTFVVGGKNATNTSLIESNGTLYLGKKICMHVPVPQDATLSTRKTIIQTLTEEQKEDSMTFIMEQEDDKQQDVVGLSVEISVSEMRIHERQKACSVSHVVWEQVEATP